MKTKQVNDIDTTNLTIVIDFNHKIKRESYNIGALKLKNTENNKDLILNVCQTFKMGNNRVIVRCDLEFDNNINNSFKNNMFLDDIKRNITNATLFIGDEGPDEDLEGMTLYVRNGCRTTLIDIKQEL